MIELIETQHGEPCLDPEIKQRMSSSSKAKSTRHFVARRDGSDIGFVALDANLGINYLALYELFVPVRLRGAGLGALLIVEIEKYAAAEGYQRVTLTPSPLELGFSAARLAAWYKRRGYTERPEVPSELEKWIV